MTDESENNLSDSLKSFLDGLLTGLLFDCVNELAALEFAVFVAAGSKCSKPKNKYFGDYEKLVKKYGMIPTSDNIPVLSRFF